MACEVGSMTRGVAVSVPAPLVFFSFGWDGDEHLDKQSAVCLRIGRRGVGERGGWWVVFCKKVGWEGGDVG